MVDASVIVWLIALSAAVCGDEHVLSEVFGVDRDPNLSSSKMKWPSAVCCTFVCGSCMDCAVTVSTRDG